MATVVLGYDNSAGSKAALAKAIDLAKTYGDRLVIGYGFAPSATVGEEFTEHQKALRELGEKHTAQALAEAATEGVEADWSWWPTVPRAPSSTSPSATTRASSWSAPTGRARSREPSSAPRHTSCSTWLRHRW